MNIDSAELLTASRKKEKNWDGDVPLVGLPVSVGNQGLEIDTDVMPKSPPISGTRKQQEFQDSTVALLQTLTFSSGKPTPSPSLRSRRTSRIESVSPLLRSSRAPSPNSDDGSELFSALKLLTLPTTYADAPTSWVGPRRKVKRTWSSTIYDDDNFEEGKPTVREELTDEKKEEIRLQILKTKEKLMREFGMVVEEEDPESSVEKETSEQEEAVTDEAASEKELSTNGQASNNAAMDEPIANEQSANEQSTNERDEESLHYAYVEGIAIPREQEREHIERANHWLKGLPEAYESPFEKSPEAFLEVQDRKDSATDSILSQTSHSEMFTGESLISQYSWSDVTSRVSDSFASIQLDVASFLNPFGPLVDTTNPYRLRLDHEVKLRFRMHGKVQKDLRRYWLAKHEEETAVDVVKRYVRKLDKKSTSEFEPEIETDMNTGEESYIIHPLEEDNWRSVWALAFLKRCVEERW